MYEKGLLLFEAWQWQLALDSPRGGKVVGYYFEITVDRQASYLK